MAPVRRRVAPIPTTLSEAKPYTQPKPKPRHKSKRTLSPEASIPALSVDQTLYEFTPHTAHLPQIKDLLSSETSPLHAYTAPKAASPLTFDLRSATDLSDAELQTCMDIVETTSGDAYRASSSGWKPKAKKTEMRDDGMVYVLVRRDTGSHNPNDEDQRQDPGSGDKENLEGEGVQEQQDVKWPSTSILAFISFLPTTDDPPFESRRVLYIYELHLHPSLRGRGLGSALIRFVEASARVLGLGKTMLTVFTSNVAAKAVYGKLGYVVDKCSPVGRRVRGRVVKESYEILSKELGQ